MATQLPPLPSENQNPWYETRQAWDEAVKVAIEEGLQILIDFADPSIAFVVVDEDNRRTELEVGADGKFTQRVVDSLAERMDIAPPDLDAQVRSGPDILAIGDSMTNGTGGAGVNYPGVLETLSGRTVRRESVGGEDSPTIAARVGGVPFEFTINGGVIPASGSVEVTLRPIRGIVPNLLVQGGGDGAGFIILPDGEKLAGDFSRAGGVYSFTRTTAGDAIPCATPVRFRWDRMEERRGDIFIIWIGQNGSHENKDERAVQDARAIVDRMDALDKRFLVIPRPSSNDAIDDMWLAEFGDRVVLARQYLSEFGLADAGITPTPEDVTAMSNGSVPPSLKSDGTHWNAAGYTVLAHIVHKKLIEMGWMD